VWVRQIQQLHLTIPRSSALFVSCASGTFLGGSQGGAGMPPLVTHNVQHLVTCRTYSDFFSLQTTTPGYCNVQRFFLFLVDFSIFSSLLKIILVLGIRFLVSTEYLKILYILYSEW
jgi:hypothetical protein